MAHELVKHHTELFICFYCGYVLVFEVLILEKDSLKTVALGLCAALSSLLRLFQEALLVNFPH